MKFGFGRGIIILLQLFHDLRRTVWRAVINNQYVKVLCQSKDAINNGTNVFAFFVCRNNNYRVAQGITG
jgi:hypothetical protein